MADPQDSQTIVFFDGVCHLCNGFVDFVISRDRSHRIFFAPLQGETAHRRLQIEDRLVLESLVLFAGGKTYRRSQAVLRILFQMGGPWLVLGLLGSAVPLGLRDRIYAFVAKNRFKWFGRREFCRLPSPGEKGQLLP